MILFLLRRGRGNKMDITIKHQYLIVNLAVKMNSLRKSESIA